VNRCAHNVWARAIAAAALIAGAISAPALVGGCATDPTEGYAAMSIFPEGVATVAVPIFENKTFVREVEFDLTDALVKEIEARTPYRVTTESRADTMLSGTIVRVDLRQVSKSPATGLTEEMIVSVVVDFEWRDLRVGRPMILRKSFAGHGLFVPSQPTGERIELGRFSAVQHLARDIVNELQAPW